MVCTNCGNDNKGVKLNGLLYCANCGKEMPATDDNPNGTAKIPEAKIITPKKDEIESKIDELGAELKALDILEQESKSAKEAAESKSEIDKLEAAEALIDQLEVENSKPETIVDTDGKQVEAAKVTTPVIKKTNRMHLKHPSLKEDALATIQEEAKAISSSTEKNNNAAPPLNEPKETVEPEPQAVMNAEPTTEESKPVEKIADSASEIYEPEPAVVEETMTFNSPTVDSDKPAEIITPAKEDDANSKKEVVEETEPITYTPEELETKVKETQQTITEINNQENDTEKPNLSINLVQPEKGYCVKCKALRGINDPNEVIMKNGHPALKGKCDVCGTTIFKIKKGGKEEGYKLTRAKSTEKKHEKSKNQFLTGFFKAGVASASKQQQDKKEHAELPASVKEPKRKEKEQKHKGKFSWKLFWGILIPIIFILAFIGLMLYVNFFAISPERATNGAEEKTKFSYTKPEYIPAGYKTSKDTYATENQISYAYDLVIVEGSSEKISDTLKIVVTKFDGEPDNIFAEKVKNSGNEYQEETIDETTIWVIDDKNIVFYDNGVLYEINSSGKISKGELIKIAESIIK